MAIIVRAFLGFVFTLVLFSLGVGGSYDYLYQEDTERVENENRAGRLLELIEFTNLGKTKSAPEISGRSRKSSITRQSSDGSGSSDTVDANTWFDYTWFGPMVDEILLGRYCKRDYFKAVAEACNTILGYAAVNLGQKKKYPSPAQVAANLTAVTKGDFGKDMVTFAPEGIIWYNRTKPLGSPGKQSTMLVFVPKSTVTLECNIPTHTFTATIYLKAIKKVKDGTEWKTIVSNVKETFEESVTILVLDYGEFVGDLSCSWTSKSIASTGSRFKI